MTAGMITLLTFGATTAGVFGLYSVVTDIFLRDRLRINERLADEFPDKIRRRIRRSPLFKDLNLLHSATSETRPGVGQRIDEMLMQAGLEWTFAQLVLMSVTAWALAALVGTLVTLNVFAGVAIGLIGVWVPLAFVYTKRQKRQRMLRNQLAEAFELMSRAVSAGQTMSAAMQMVATDAKEPISHEFAYCCEQQNLGLPQDVALRELARRTGVMELQMFVVAALVQRQTGGNLGELLDSFSVIIRKRIKMMGRIKALTSEGRLQAAVLTVLPIVAFAAIYILDRAYAQILLERPKVLLATVASVAVGALWIRSIVNFDH